MTADGWLRFYYATRDSIGAPGLDFVDSTGRVFAKRCDACEGKKRHGTKLGDYVCGHCGAPWPYVDQQIFKGEVQKTARCGSFDDSLGRYFDVAKLLGEFMKEHPWDAKLYIAHVVAGLSFAELGPEFERRFARPPLSKSSAYRRVQSARAAWDRKLRRAGIDVCAS